MPEYSVVVDIVTTDPIDLEAVGNLFNDQGISVLHGDQRDACRIGGTFTEEAPTLAAAVARGVERFTVVLCGEVVHASACTFEELARNRC